MFDRDVVKLLNPRKIKRNAASVGIQLFEEDFFGQLGFNRSTHTTQYLGLHDGCDPRFDPNAQLFYEATDPCATTFCLNDRSLEHLRILRYRYRRFTEDDIAIMVRGAREVVNMRQQPDGSWKGDKYDYGHFASFIIWKLLGYPENATPLLDQGETRHICSVYIRAIFEYLRKVRTAEGKPEYLPRLFNIGDLTMWRLAGKLAHAHPKNLPVLVGESDGFENVSKTPVEWTWPACFDNSHYYSNEFELIAEFKNGRIRN